MSEMLLAQLEGVPVKELQEVWSPDLILRSSDGSPRLTTVPKDPTLAGGYDFENHVAFKLASDS
jgi:LacI family transcriptional regulator